MTNPQSSEDVYGRFLGVKVHTLIAWGCVVTVGVGVGYVLVKYPSWRSPEFRPGLVENSGELF